MGLLGTPLVECRHCRFVVRGNIDDVVARCPRCRYPLFERQERMRRPPRNMAGAGPCPAHPASESVARCQRCDQLLCGICRTRWQEEVLCLDCFNQALETKEPLPREANQQRQQGKRSLLWALVGWMLLLTGVLVFLLQRDGQTNKDLAYLGLGLLLGCLPPALWSIGQAFAVIRGRGRSWQLATWSFVLAGSQLGAMLGLVLLNLWHN